MHERDMFEQAAALSFDLVKDPTGEYIDRDTQLAWHVWSIRAETSPHCVTCQCNRINQPAPVPGNEMSKAWHHLAAGKPPSTG
jgi:hypothetical protein